MASNLVVNFIGNNKLSKTTAVIRNDLKKLGSTAQSVGNSLNRSLGAVGLGLGLSKLTGYLKEAAKAAGEDANSQKQLALSLQNTIGATASSISYAEKWIQSLSNTVGVLDDELRPALATAVRATGSLESGQNLLTTALDISASTGKNLSQVTNALSKAQNGNLTSLKKLLPGMKLGANFMADLQDQFAGAAELASNTDPFKKLTVLFDNFKEGIGQELLPYIREFSEYLASPEGQANMRQIAQILVSIGRAIGTVVGFLIKNFALVKALVAGYITVKLAIGAMTFAMKVYDLAVKVATVSTKALKYALVSTGIGALIAVVGTLAAAWMEANDAQEEYAAFQFPTTEAFDKALEEAFATVGEGYIEINRELGKIWKNGVLVFDQNAFDMRMQEIDDAIAAAQDRIKKTAERFRDTVGLAFGVSGKDEFSFFNVDMVIEKLKRVVNAARGFKENIQKLVKQGAGQDVVNELIGMGPAQGNIVAKGLLKSGRLSEYLGLRGSLYGTGTQVQTVAEATQEKTYNININKANVSAADIIKEIRKFEKQTGKKYFAN